MITLSLTVGTEALGLAVCAVAVCRLRCLHLVRYQGRAHQTGWVMAYMLMAIAGLLGFHEAWSIGPSLALLLALTACALWLWLTRKTWRDGAPRYLERRA